MRPSLLACLAAASLAATAAHAQTASFTSTSSYFDKLYDFDLYVANPESATGWYVLFTYDDGSTYTSYAFDTEEDAEDYLFYLNWYGLDPQGGWYDADNGYSTTVYQGARTPDWVFYQRYGTSASAADAADWFEDELGMLTRVSRVAAYQLRATTTSDWSSKTAN